MFSKPRKTILSFLPPAASDGRKERSYLFIFFILPFRRRRFEIAFPFGFKYARVVGEKARYINFSNNASIIVLRGINIISGGFERAFDVYINDG